MAMTHIHHIKLKVFMKLLESDMYIFGQVPSNVVLWIYHCTMCHQRMKRILLVQAL